MKKNILLVVVDCLRADHVYEDKAHTPNMDLLRKNGFTLPNTIASTSTTTPSFSSLLTGLYPFENGVRSHTGYSLNKEIKTFPETLRENGYNTYAEMCGPLGSETGLNKGFKEYNFRDRNHTFDTLWGDMFLEKLKTHYREPWFIMLHVWGLHEPRVVLPEMNDKKYGKTPYARSVSSIDKFLGRIIDSLDPNTIIAVTGDHGEQIESSEFDRIQKRIRLKALRWFMRRGLSKKPSSKAVRGINVGHTYTIYDDLMKVPLIFYNESVFPKGESPTQIRQIDIVPTLLDAAGVNPGKTTGKSAMQIVKGKDSKNRDAYMEAVGAVIPKEEDWIAGLRIDNKYKYIYSPFREDFEEELYDLEKDPNERNNIASENPILIKDLKAKIESMKTTEMVGEKIDESDEAMMKERLKDLGYM